MEAQSFGQKVLCLVEARIHRAYLPALLNTGLCKIGHVRNAVGWQEAHEPRKKTMEFIDHANDGTILEVIMQTRKDVPLVSSLFQKAYLLADLIVTVKTMS